MCEKFNGWQNKPTWLVNVWGWLDNPEQYEDLIKQAVDDQIKNEYIKDNKRILQSAIYFRLGELLEEYVHEALEIDKGNLNRLSQSTEASNGFEQDLINWSLAIVNWKGLAECLEEPVKEYLKEAHSVVVK